MVEPLESQHKQRFLLWDISELGREVLNRNNVSVFPCRFIAIVTPCNNFCVKKITAFVQKICTRLSPQPRSPEMHVYQVGKMFFMDSSLAACDSEVKHCSLA